MDASLVIKQHLFTDSNFQLLNTGPPSEIRSAFMNFYANTLRKREREKLTICTTKRSFQTC